MILTKEEFLANTQSFNDLNQSDLKLKKHINHPFGFYIEAGANDGISQEYTKIYEEFLGWKGILIEPSKYAFDLCKINRPNDIVLNCALVDSDDIEFVHGDFDGASMSSIDGDRRGHAYPLVKVPARTLTSILKEYDVKDIDLISLDVEGYELNALKGLDFNIWKPKYFIIETYVKDREEIKSFLSTYNYEIVENITENATWNQTWDGTHEDFLFKLKS